MTRTLLPLLFVLAGCTLKNTEDRFAASGHVVLNQDGAKSGVAGALVQACSVNPISFGTYMNKPEFCEKEELVHSGPDGSFTITSHKELRLGGLFFGPPHGSGEDYIYTVLTACHKDGAMGHAEVKYPNSKDVELPVYLGQGFASVDVPRCTRLLGANAAPK